MLFSKFFFFFFGRKSGNFGVLMSKKSGANVPQNILVLCALHSGYSAASIIIFLRCIAWLDFRCHSWLAAPPLGVGANYDHATLIKSMARQFIKKNIRGPKPLSGIMPCCYLSLSLLPTPPLLSHEENFDLQYAELDLIPHKTCVPSWVQILQTIDNFMSHGKKLCMIL